MAGEITKAAAEAGAKAAMDLSLSGAGFSVSLKIDNVWLAGAVSIGTLSLGAFYLASKGPAENTIKRALERKIFGYSGPRGYKHYRRAFYSSGIALPHRNDPFVVLGRCRDENS